MKQIELILIKFILTTLLLLAIIKQTHCLGKDEASELKPNFQISINGSNKIHVFCKEKAPKSLLHLWKHNYVYIHKVPKEFMIFTGNNASNIHDQYIAKSSSWFSFNPWKQTSVTLPAFQEACIGITATELCVFEFILRYINYWSIVMFTVGLFLFFAAPILSRNVVFYYATGVSIGVCASILIALFILSRFIPKKYGAYSFFLFGSSVVLCLFQWAFEHARYILTAYWMYLLGYCLVASLVSFVICYRLGPVSNVRTLNLIQWLIQVIGLILMFTSSEYFEASLAIILLVILIYLFPPNWTTKFMTIWRRWFPPKIKLLTEEEFIYQGNIETKKALAHLREYCNSPDCKSWTLIKSLKNPNRFASFVEGDSHLTDDEFIMYDADQSYEQDNDTDENLEQ